MKKQLRHRWPLNTARSKNGRIDKFYIQQTKSNPGGIWATVILGRAVLIAALANGELREDIEGTAAIFLFRHYLELMLKRVLFSGRILASGDELAAVEDIAEVSKTHDLATIWDWVIKDAKPKLPEWDNYDVASVKQCVMEFHKADRGGVAFRYDREGGELYRFDFAALNDQMDHIPQVLEGIWTGLSELAHAIREYEAELQSEYGSDLYW